MHKRELVFADGQIYHLYNRSIAKEKIFSNSFTLRQMNDVVSFYRIPQSIRYSKFKQMNREKRDDYLMIIRNKLPQVEIYAYAFMPNHFHFLLKQIQGDGIRKFISNAQNSFAKYFNLKYDRTGSLFESPFKAKLIETDEELIHVSRYIHLNPVTSYLIRFEDLSSYALNSFSVYAGKRNCEWLNTEFIMSMFKSFDEYNLFHKDQVDYQRSLAKIRDLLLE